MVISLYVFIIKKRHNMKKYLIILGVILISGRIHGQNNDVIKNEIYDIESIKNAKTLTYYGLDFSLIKFVKPQDSEKDEELRKFLGAWLAFYQKEIPPETFIKTRLKFKNYDFNDYSVQIRTDSVKKDWVVIATREITIDDISAVIRTYNLGNDNGLGFVIHPVEFNNLKKTTKCYFTFFDISTKKILWITETSGELGIGIVGVTGLYGYGMVHCTLTYLDKVYSKGIKE